MLLLLHQNGLIGKKCLKIILISLAYYFAYHVGKDLGWDLAGIWTDFVMIIDSFWMILVEFEIFNEFGGCSDL